AYELSKQRRLEEDKRRIEEDARRRDEDKQRQREGMDSTACLLLIALDEQFRRAMEEARSFIEAEKLKLEVERQQMQSKFATSNSQRTMEEKARRVSDAIGALYAIRIALLYRGEQLKLS